MGGGGKGMRVVRDRADLIPSFESASSEALASFGDGSCFVERFVERPRHIEVQIIGDGRGDVIHLWERDCSIQRRHQKVIEMAPAWSLPDELRAELHKYAVELTSAAKYKNAGTVEFLLDQQNRPYFIEVNPRIQVEHTVTEEVTGIDVVQTQIRIAGGATFEEIGLKQEDIVPRGVAIQCRVTTENPERDFAPDTGVISLYRHSAGAGIRMDGVGYSGLAITPYFDSMIVKYTARGGDVRGDRGEDEARAHRVPHQGRQDQHSIFAQRADPSGIRDRGGNDGLHRREPGAQDGEPIDVGLRERRAERSAQGGGEGTLDKVPGKPSRQWTPPRAWG